VPECAERRSVRRNWREKKRVERVCVVCGERKTEWRERKREECICLWRVWRESMERELERERVGWGGVGREGESVYESVVT
jgi:hypothetical protein